MKTMGEPFPIDITELVILLLSMVVIDQFLTMFSPASSSSSPSVARGTLMVTVGFGEASLPQSTMQWLSQYSIVLHQKLEGSHDGQRGLSGGHQVMRTIEQ